MSDTTIPQQLSEHAAKSEEFRSILYQMATQAWIGLLLIVAAAVWWALRMSLGKAVDYFKTMDARLEALEKSKVEVQACHKANAQVLNAVEKLRAEQRAALKELAEAQRAERHETSTLLRDVHSRVDEHLKGHP